MALQLRFLQSLVQVAAEKNETIVLPIPVDIVKLIVDSMKK